MKNQSAETNSKDPKLARRDFIKTTAAAGAGLLIAPSAIAFGSMANSSHGPGILRSGGRGNYAGGELIFERECNVGQGYNFNKNERHTYGYINTLVIGGAKITPDIRVLSPGATKPVFSVLSKVSWDMDRGTPITFEGRVSAENAAGLRALIQQSMAFPIVTLSFVVYEYDQENQVYFTCFKPSTTTQPGPSPTAPPINARISEPRELPLGLYVDPTPAIDPAGIRNHAFGLTVIPPGPGEQLLQIQNSINKTIRKPWGLSRP